LKFSIIAEATVRASNPIRFAYSTPRAHPRIFLVVFNQLVYYEGSRRKKF
jgi:hypothetical protein